MHKQSRARRSAILAGLLTTICQPAVAQELSDVEIDPQYVDEVAKLRGSADVDKAMRHVLTLEAQHREELIELTEIPAPPFKEMARAERFAEMLRAAGLDDVSIDEVGNVIGRRPGTGGQRVVGYSAHLDTVFPEDTDVTVRFDDDKMYAPGIGDNTRGLVVVLAVLRALEHAAIRTDADILFIGNVGEEGLGDLRGVKHLFRDGASAIDSLIAVDGGDDDRIVYGGVGSHRYRMAFSGPGGHSWGAFGTANPHHALGRAIALFDENAPAVTGDGVKSSYNIGRIGGGTSINSVPFESWAEVDIRSGDQAKIDAIDDILQAAVEQALQEENAGRTIGAELTAELERVGTRPAAQGDEGAALVQRALAVTRSFDLEPRLGISSTDANLPISKGIPAITMSRGGQSYDSHAPTEAWSNVSGYRGIQIGLLTLLAEAGLTP
ncbi:MAG: M20/M25/M40 family metallo-hydrolase [Henriciella sp.]|uniref:M20/M25/M40 family metallo-hydrolase n=1 Tax=Henriciella sp. TaxID=1968823 RepID=UPI003C736339